MIGRVLLPIAALALGSAVAPAGAIGGPIFTKGGLETVSHGSILSYAPADLSDHGLVKIFDNLATKDPKGVYWAQLGATITGPNAARDFQEYWAATAFTPAADHSVTKIEIAVTYISGTNGVVVSLNSDSNGLPGAPLETWNLTGLPKFLSCCTLDTATDSKGIPITGGTQYWVVVSTDSSDADFWGGANINVANEVDPAVTASWCSDDVGGTCTNPNDAWTLQTGILPGFAFAVLGSS